MQILHKTIKKAINMNSFVKIVRKEKRFRLHKRWRLTYRRGGFIKKEKAYYMFLIAKVLVVLVLLLEFVRLVGNVCGVPIKKEGTSMGTFGRLEVQEQFKINQYVVSVQSVLRHICTNKIIKTSDILVETTNLIALTQSDMASNDIIVNKIDDFYEPETIVEQLNNYIGVFEGTWYCATDMGYSTPPYGSSGRTLETGYSVASNYFPSGTLLYIEGAGVTGTYRVDDTGGMSSNVIDFYYWDRAFVPQSFLISGRINIEVYIL